ncbi:CBO0543 family protein [Pseudalkalibacillus hwajinpoensis]|uniref:CBO0543 family protein n=1 Tax=Guptibacillus hwajinpoensis TaxID=208199 RepID=UPI001CD7F1AA|nr:CBO0543 family protein [Pseudalkalibacillus hwajinpoensis]MCA0989746.1 hypothetical protein [Pseudalkalibacillus hwajinpoensis]
MNIGIVILLALLALWKADWRNWEKYYPSMLYIALAASVYEIIAYEKFHLWDFKESILLSKVMVHFIHNLIINPLVVLLFLSNYPSSGSEVIYNAKWVVGFWIVECLVSTTDAITYHNGWNLGWSLLFLIVMFPMVRLHHLNKSLALPLSIGISLLLLLLFDYI